MLYCTILYYAIPGHVKTWLEIRWCVKCSKVLRESSKAVLISKWFDGGLKLCKEHGQITCPAPAEHR